MIEKINSATVDSLKRIPLDQVPAAIAFLTARILTEMSDQRRDVTTTPDSEELLTAKQLAALLNVPESWVRTEQRAGRIPALRLGKYVRFRRAEVEAVIASSRCASDDIPAHIQNGVFAADAHRRTRPPPAS